MTRLHQLPDLLRALQNTQAEAIAEGLIEAAGESTSARNGLASSPSPENQNRRQRPPERRATAFQKGNCP